MNQLNSVLVEGNLCRDAELRHTPSGVVICKMSIATTRCYKSGENFEKEVSFFDVDCFGKAAELCAGYGKKGIGLRVTGRLKQNRWQDKNGTTRSQVVIIAEHVEFRQKQQDSSGDTLPDVDF